jgi:hypothetical protein
VLPVPPPVVAPPPILPQELKKAPKTKIKRAMKSLRLKAFLMVLPPAVNLIAFKLASGELIDFAEFWTVSIGHFLHFKLCETT